MEKKKAIRCAVYTRKSTEEGLDQQYNTLDAQRDAGENYIKSQQHEGWGILPQRYGHVVKDGEDFSNEIMEGEAEELLRQNAVIAEREAEELLRQDAVIAERAVLRLISRPCPITDLRPSLSPR